MSQAAAICNRLSQLKSERLTFERAWQDIRELVRPHTTDFQKFSSPGDVRTESVYDGTAIQACEELASALHSYMSSPTERWFSLEVENRPDLNRDPEAIEWLEMVADAIYNEYSNDQTAMVSSIHECYLDIGAFGNAILYQDYDSAERHLVFRSHPLADCFFQENSNGRVDAMDRIVHMTTRQLLHAFADAVPREVAEQPPDRKWEVVHSVFPRAERIRDFVTPQNMRWASFWVLVEKSLVLKESGYNSFPYAIGRWSKLSSEVYGRGPAIKCLPDIKMLNRMEYTIIKAAQKAVDPPLTVPNDGFMLPIKTSPGSLNFKEPNAESLEPLEHKGNLPIGLEISNQKRETIRTCFYADWVKLMPKKERQTAYEISELVEQQLRMMAPMLGRINTELLSPMVARSYELLASANRIPENPGILDGTRIKVIYVSPAARAQTGTKAVLMGKYAQELIPIAQVDPSVMDAIDWDAYAQELALVRGVTRRILRSPREIEEIRQQRAQEQQMQQMATVAEPASKAVKNLAEANQAGNIL